MNSNKLFSVYENKSTEQIPEDLEYDDSSIMQEKIHFRKKRVNQLRLRGYSLEEIAKTIGCSLSTIEKDVNANREKSRCWFEEEAILDYCESVHDAIVVHDNAIDDLSKLYDEDDNSESKLKILSSVLLFEEKKISLYERTKSVKKYLVGDN